jgi:hypothetical protein
MPPDDSALSLLPDHPLAAHNTFGIAANARFAARITHAAQFEALHRDPRVANLPQLVLCSATVDEELPTRIGAALGLRSDLSSASASSTLDLSLRLVALSGRAVAPASSSTPSAPSRMNASRSASVGSCTTGTCSGTTIGAVSARRQGRFMRRPRPPPIATSSFTSA